MKEVVISFFVYLQNFCYLIIPFVVSGCVDLWLQTQVLQGWVTLALLVRVIWMD